MKPFLALSIALCVIGSRAFAGDPPKPPDCLPPLKGPMWLQDFTDSQKTDLKVKWEPSEKDNTIRYSVEGKYPEPLDTSRAYTKYRHLSEIESVEIWTCNKDHVPEFKSIDGEVESNLESHSESIDTKEVYEQQNKFVIKGPEDYRHVKHKSEREIEVRSETLSKDSNERTNWTQSWETGTPVVSGKTKEKVTEKYYIPGGGRQLASPILVPGFEPSPLKPEVHLVVEKETKGVFNGPLDPISMESKQTVKQIREDKTVETKEIQTHQDSEFVYNGKAKKYDFVKMNELYEEKVVNPEAGFKNKYARLDTWTTPEPNPTKSSFWKETYRRSKFGGSAELTLTSKGHGFMPKLFTFENKEGSYSRITDYSSAGKIVRFQVLFFPEGAKQNKTLMDLHFGEGGELKEFVVLDSAINAYQNVLQNPAALYALQTRVNELKEMEKFATLKGLPERTIREADYPFIYQPATGK